MKEGLRAMPGLDYPSQHPRESAWPAPQTKCCILQLICETESRDRFPFLSLSYILFPYLKFLKKGNNSKSYQRSMNKPKMKENRSSNRGSWWLARDTSCAWRGRGLLISYTGTRPCMEFRFVHGKQMIGDGATRDCAKRTAGARRGKGYPCELLAPARWSLDVCRRWQEDLAISDSGAQYLGKQKNKKKTTTPLPFLSRSFPFTKENHSLLLSLSLLNPHNLVFAGCL